MEMLETLRRSGAVDALARQLGIEPARAASGVEALLPAVLDGFRRRANDAGGGEAGLRDMVEMLSVLGGHDMARNVLFPEATEIRKGEALLVQLIGLEDASRMAELEGARKTGLDPDILLRMSPILAMFVGGYLAARVRGLDLIDRKGISIEDLIGAQEG